MTTPNLTYAGQRLTSGLMNRFYSITSTGTYTVTAASAEQLSAAFTIPGGDAALDTAYRLTAYGNGTWGSTAQQLNLYSYLGGSQANNMGIQSTAFSTGQNFYWKATLLVAVTTVGTSGQVTCVLQGLFSPTTSGASGGAQELRYVTTSFDTTVSNVVELECAWASTTGAPTITCGATLIEKLGTS